MNITDEMVERAADLIGGGSTFDREERIEMATAILRSALASHDAGEGETLEPVAWRLSKEDGRCRVTLLKRVAEIWADQRAKVEPLYPAATVERLRRERDTQSKLYRQAMLRAKRAEADRDKALAENRRLRELFDAYGNHHESCDLAQPDCSCGMRYAYHVVMHKELAR